jgi:hypothetical protein
VLGCPRHHHPQRRRRYIQPIIGRYVHIVIDGETITISRKTARAFRWCVCTAGSMHDCGGTARRRGVYKISASSPSTCPGTASQSDGKLSGEEYQLTTARYTATIRAFARR